MSDAAPSHDLPATGGPGPQRLPLPGLEFDGLLDPQSDPLRVVRAWAAQGACPVDPVRLSVIEGLARRASGQQGPARQVMLQRLTAWMAQAPNAPQAIPAAECDAAAAQASGLASLSALVDRLGRLTPAAQTPTVPPPAASARPTGSGGHRKAGPAPARPQPSAALARALPPQPLKAVAAYQGTWSRLRAEQRLRQALAQVPQKAGPLNSSHVVHRALKALYELSPAYLDAFMAHIDTLLALEQASGAGDLAAPRNALSPTSGGGAATPATRRQSRGESR